MHGPRRGSRRTALESTVDGSRTTRHGLSLLPQTDGDTPRQVYPQGRVCDGRLYTTRTIAGIFPSVAPSVPLNGDVYPYDVKPCDVTGTRPSSSRPVCVKSSLFVEQNYSGDLFQCYDCKTNKCKCMYIVEKKVRKDRVPPVSRRLESSLEHSLRK